MPTESACTVNRRVLQLSVGVPGPNGPAAAGTASTAFLWGYVNGTGTSSQLVSRAQAVVRAATVAFNGTRQPDQPTTAADGLPSAVAKRAARDRVLRESIALTGLAGAGDRLQGRFGWLGREIEWHSGYVLGARTRSTFWNETLLDQGTQYRYVAGFQGAMRDPLQHAMPLALSAPSSARSILRLSLKQLQNPSRPSPLGHQRFLSPYALTSQGLLMTFNLIPSDQELWLPMLAADTTLAMRDFSVLQETIPRYYDPSGSLSHR